MFYFSLRVFFVGSFLSFKFIIDLVFLDFGIVVIIFWLLLYYFVKWNLFFFSNVCS